HVILSGVYGAFAVTALIIVGYICLSSEIGAARVASESI
ncbi:unnamed protein product, partial [Rotaria sp. Silwood2]